MKNYIITWIDSTGKFRVNEIKAEFESIAFELLGLKHPDFKKLITSIEFNG